MWLLLIPQILGGGTFFLGDSATTTDGGEIRLIW